MSTDKTEIVELSPEQQEIQASYEANRTLDGQGNKWVVEWMLGILGQCDQTEAALTQRYKELLKRIDNKRKHLDYAFGDVFKDEADKLIAQERKGKSHKLLTGTVSYRTLKGRLEIVDMEAVIKWACGNLTTENISVMVNAVDIIESLSHVPKKHFTSIITSIRVSALQSHLKATGEIPDGCIVTDSTEKFYAKPAVPKLEGGE